MMMMMVMVMVMVMTRSRSARLDFFEHFMNCMTYDTALYDIGLYQSVVFNGVHLLPFSGWLLCDCCGAISSAAFA